jgi:hypothetical protein
VNDGPRFYLLLFFLSQATANGSMLAVFTSAVPSFELMHATIPSAPGSAAATAAALLEAGALLAVPAPSGASVSLLLPEEHGIDGSELELLESMWEPDDWHESPTTFEAMVVSSKLKVQPLPLAAAAIDSKAGACAEVRLLEHPHAFLTTAAGKLHVSTLNVLELLVAHAPELRGARRILDMGCGSGVLSLAALALASHRNGEVEGDEANGGSGTPALTAYGVDVHEPAICAARRNALLNGFGECAQFGFIWDVSSRLEADVSVANMMPGREHACGICEPSRPAHLKPPCSPQASPPPPCTRTATAPPLVATRDLTRERRLSPFLSCWLRIYIGCRLQHSSRWHPT